MNKKKIGKKLSSIINYDSDIEIIKPNCGTITSESTSEKCQPISGLSLITL